MRSLPSLIAPLLVALTFWQGTARAQAFPAGWTAIDTSGLPSDTITAIAWPYVGTTQGLAYYDGTGFVTQVSDPLFAEVAASPVRFIGQGWMANNEGVYMYWYDNGESGSSGFGFESMYDYYSGGCFYDEWGSETCFDMFGGDPGSGEDEFEGVSEVYVHSKEPYDSDVIELVYETGGWVTLMPSESTCAYPEDGDSDCYYRVVGNSSGTNSVVLENGLLWASVPGAPEEGAGIYEYYWREYTREIGEFGEFEFGEWARRDDVPFQRDRTGLCLENTADMAYSGGLLYAAYTSYGETLTGDQCEDDAARLGSSLDRLATRRPRMGSYDGSTWTRSGSGSAARRAQATVRAPLPDGVPAGVSAVGNAVMLAARPDGGVGGGVAWTTDITAPNGWTTFQAEDPVVPLSNNEITAVGTVGRGFVVGTTDGLAIYTLPELAPSLSAPVAGATDVPSTPVLRWALPPGAESSTVQLSLASDFSAVLNEWTTAETSVAVPSALALSSGTSYYWRVRSSLSGGGESPWSGVHTFTTGEASLVRHGRGQDALAIDAAGTVYTASESTVLSYDGGTWSTVSIPPVSASSTTKVAISASQAGVVWAGGESTLQINGPSFYDVLGGGLGRLSGGAWETVVPVDSDEDGFPVIAAVDPDTAWVCTGGWTTQGEVVTGGLVRFAAGVRQASWDSVGPCETLAADADGDAWVGSGTSLYHVTPGGTAVHSAPFGTTTGSVTAISVGDDGTVWIGTEDGATGGIAQYDPGTDAWTSHAWPWSGIRAVDAAGGVVWAGSGQGLARYEGGAWTLWGASNGTLPPGGVTSVIAVDAETVWAMSSEGALEFTAPSTVATASLLIAGPEGWHQLAAPLGGPTVGDLLGPVWTQGFPGADAPQGDPTVLFYDEAAPCDADPGTATPPCDASTGYASAGAAADALASGTGLFAYLFADDDPTADGVQGGFPKTLTVSGVEPALPFAFPALSHTDTGSPADDGWNLVGNPLAAPLDWDAVGWTKTAVSNAIYAYDPAAGEYLTWNGSVGTLPDGEVPVGRGFWVQATGPGPALEAPVGARVEPGASSASLGAVASAAAGARAPDVFELRLTGTTTRGERGSSAFVVFGVEGAEVGPDAYDAYALVPPSEAYVLASAEQPEDGEALSILALPAAEGVIGPDGLDVRVSAASSGLVADTLRWSWSLPQGSGWSATLVDTEVGREVDLYSAAGYSFAVADSTDRHTRTSNLPGSLVVGSPRSLSIASASGRFVLRLARAPVGAEDAIPTALVVEAPAPNPARAGVRVRYALPAPSDVEIAVYDLLGRRVVADRFGERAPGVHVQDLDLDALAAGVYVVRTEVRPAGGEARTFTHKLTVVR